MPNYECSKCGAQAGVVFGKVVRTCEHTSEPVTLNLKATATGESSTGNK